MSYIRSLTNPEELYIWGDGKDVHVSGKKIKREITIPEKTFEGLLKKFVKGYWEDCQYQEASIKEVFIKSKSKPNKIEKMLKLQRGHFQMRLSYKKQSVDIWLVTWIYICQRYIKT